MGASAENSFLGRGCFSGEDEALLGKKAKGAPGSASGGSGFARNDESTIEEEPREKRRFHPSVVAKKYDSILAENSKMHR